MSVDRESAISRLVYLNRFSAQLAQERVANNSKRTLFFLIASLDAIHRPQRKQQFIRYTVFPPQVLPYITFFHADTPY